MVIDERHAEKAWNPFVVPKAAPTAHPGAAAPSQAPLGRLRPTPAIVNLRDATGRLRLGSPPRRRAPLARLRVARWAPDRASTTHNRARPRRRSAPRPDRLR